MVTHQGPSVTCTLDASVATVTLGSPALSLPAKRELLDALQQVSEDDAVRAVVLTGSGRVFCAGQDLSEHAAALADPTVEAFDTLGEHYNPVVTLLTTMAKPVVAAVNGTCAGAGLSLALACDLRLAAAGARFTTAFTGIGLVPDSGLSASLSRAVGTARASELILLAEAFTAQQAHDWGLIGRVVADDDLDRTVAELAVRLAAGPTRAYATAKAAIRSAWAAPWPQVLADEARDQTALGAGVDHRDAVAAFLARRTPTFTGRD